MVGDLPTFFVGSIFRTVPNVDVMEALTSSILDSTSRQYTVSSHFCLGTGGQEGGSSNFEGRTRRCLLACTKD